MQGEYLGRGHIIVEELVLARWMVSLEEQNLYVFRGLQADFRAMVSSLMMKGTPMTIAKLSDYLTVQKFINFDDLQSTEMGVVPTVMVARRGG